MLRLTFWILLAANVVMFAVTQTYTDSPKKQVEPPQLKPIHAERIRLLPSSLIPPKSSPAHTVPAEQPDETTSCIEIGEFDPASARLFGDKLKQLLPAGSVELLPSEIPLSYMVYLPAAKNKKAAEQRIGELKRKGITNYFLITHGVQFKNAISLGIFKKEETARALVAELQRLGYDDVQTHVRTRQTGSGQYLILNPDKKQMEQIDLVLTDFPQASKKACSSKKNSSKVK